MAQRAGLDEGVVIAAAIGLIQEEGLVALSLSHLAAKLGVRTPSLYKHISGLDGLHRGIALWGVRELAKRMSRAALGKAGDEALMAFADAYRQFAKDFPGVYTLSQRAPDVDDKDLAAASSELIELLCVVLRPYGLDETATIHTIRGFRALVHGFASLEILGGFGMPLDVDTSFRHLVTVFIQGLRRV